MSLSRRAARRTRAVMHAVRRSPDESSAIIANLSYDIVRTAHSLAPPVRLDVLNDPELNRKPELLRAGAELNQAQEMRFIREKGGSLMRFCRAKTTISRSALLMR